jgi:hypothetical protein
VQALESGLLGRRRKPSAASDFLRLTGIAIDDDGVVAVDEIADSINKPL